eukprot:5107984-Amphidinium_carterae.1
MSHYMTGPHPCVMTVVMKANAPIALSALACHAVCHALRIESMLVGSARRRGERIDRSHGDTHLAVPSHFGIVSPPLQTIATHEHNDAEAVQRTIESNKLVANLSFESTTFCRVPS